MLIINCIPCQHGNHGDHQRVVEAVPEGMMGGAECHCEGECREQSRALYQEPEMIKRATVPGNVERGRDAARRLALEWVNEIRDKARLTKLYNWPVVNDNQDPLNLALPEGWSARLTIQSGARCGWLCRPDDSRADFLPNAPYYFLVYFNRGFYPDLIANLESDD